MNRVLVTMDRLQSAQGELDKATEALIENPNDWAARLAVNSQRAIVNDLTSDLAELVHRIPLEADQAS